MPESTRADGPIFRFIKRLLCLQVVAAPVVATALPLNPEKVPFLQTTPEGLRWIHTADSNAEADLLRQVLSDAGFHPEYVPSSNRGIFGTEGTPAIYIREEEADAAAAFITEYLNAPPTPEAND